MRKKGATQAGSYQETTSMQDILAADALREPVP
jgi:hypothetical protein